MSEEKLTVEAFLEEASDMKNKIKELKEHFKIDVTHLTKFGNRILRVACDNKARLREFFKKMLHYSQIAEFPSDQAHTNLRSFYETQLKKLDGEKTGSTCSSHEGALNGMRQPDSKPSKTFNNPDIFYCKTCQVIHRNGCINPQAQREALQPHEEYESSDVVRIDKCRLCTYLKNSQWCWSCDDYNKFEPTNKILVEREDLIKHFSGDMTAKEFKEKYLKEEEDEPR